MKQQSALISKLVEELTPRSWIHSRRARAQIWCVVSLVYLLAAVSFMSGPPLRMVMSIPFVIETMSMVALALFLGVAGVYLATPGERIPRVVLFCTPILGLVLLGLIIGIGVQTEPNGEVNVLNHAHDSMACASGILGWAIFPAVVGVWLVMMGAALRANIAAFLMFLGAGFLATAVLQFECTDQHPLHILVGHMLPAALIGTAGLFVGATALSWQRRLARAKAHLPRN